MYVVCSLLVEYAMTGKLGGEGSKDELDAYLRNIASSVVLKNQMKKITKPSSPGASHTKSKTVVVVSSNNNPNSSPAGSTSNSVESLKRETRPPPVSVDDGTASGIHDSTADAFEIEDRILDGPLTPLTTSSTDESDQTGADSGGNFDDDDDDDSLNPFARDYQPPVDKYSLTSSLASLANDSSSRNSSIPDLATYDADADTSRSSHVHLDRLRSDESFPGAGDDEDEPDSPVNLCEYECLDMDSIPKYDAFKPSIRSRVQRMNAVHTSATGTSTGMHSMSNSNHSLASYHSAQAENSSGGYPASLQSSFASSTGDDRFQFADSTVATVAATTSISSKMTKRRPKRMMDMNYSYDFQREQDYNPFMSPPMAFLPDTTEAAALGDETGRRLEELDQLDLSHTPKIEEEPPHLEEVLETQYQGEDQRNTRIEEPLPYVGVAANIQLGEEEEEDQREAGAEEPTSPELMMPEWLSDCDETEALIAALAAASEDDYNLFGEAHE